MARTAALQTHLRSLLLLAVFAAALACAQQDPNATSPQPTTTAPAPTTNATATPPPAPAPRKQSDTRLAFVLLAVALSLVGCAIAGAVAVHKWRQEDAVDVQADPRQAELHRRRKRRKNRKVEWGSGLRMNGANLLRLLEQQKREQRKEELRKEGVDVDGMTGSDFDSSSTGDSASSGDDIDSYGPPTSSSSRSTFNHDAASWEGAPATRATWPAMPVVATLSVSSTTASHAGGGDHNADSLAAAGNDGPAAVRMPSARVSPATPADGKLQPQQQPPTLGAPTAHLTVAVPATANSGATPANNTPTTPFTNPLLGVSQGATSGSHSVASPAAAGPGRSRRPSLAAADMSASAIAPTLTDPFVVNPNDLRFGVGADGAAIEMEELSVAATRLRPLHTPPDEMVVLKTTQQPLERTMHVQSLCVTPSAEPLLLLNNDDDHAARQRKQVARRPAADGARADQPLLAGADDANSDGGNSAAAAKHHAVTMPAKGPRSQQPGFFQRIVDVFTKPAAVTATDPRIQQPTGDDVFAAMARDAKELKRKKPKRTKEQRKRHKAAMGRLEMAVHVHESLEQEVYLRVHQWLTEIVPPRRLDPRSPVKTAHVFDWAAHDAEVGHRDAMARGAQQGIASDRCAAWVGAQHDPYELPGEGVGRDSPRFVPPPAYQPRRPERVQVPEQNTRSRAYVRAFGA